MSNQPKFKNVKEAQDYLKDKNSLPPSPGKEFMVVNCVPGKGKPSRVSYTEVPSPIKKLNS